MTETLSIPIRTLSIVTERLSIPIQSRPDKFFLIELVDDPRGSRSVSQTFTTTDDPSKPQTVNTQVITTTQRFVFTFQLAKKFFLLDGLSVLDNVVGGLLYRGGRAAERRRLAQAAIERVGLSHRAGHRPNQLSGCEQQRTAIARALVGRPALVMADEPTGNLDTATGAALLDLLRELHRDGTTIVVITHDHDVAAAIERRIEIRDGRIIRDSPTAA